MQARTLTRIARTTLALLASAAWTSAVAQTTWFVDVNNTLGVYHCGGGLEHYGVTSINSCILWNNGNEIDGLFIAGGKTMSVYATLQGDPEFFSPTDQHLRATSPAIDTGSTYEPLDEDGTALGQGALSYDANYPEGLSYCAATSNSTGERAAIQVSGTARIVNNDLSLSVVQVPANAASLFFIGTSQVYNPLGNGFACTGGQVARLGVAFANSSGVATLPFDNTSNLFGAPAVVAGQTRYFQNWYRDVAGGGSFFNFSNAFGVTFFP